MVDGCHFLKGGGGRSETFVLGGIKKWVDDGRERRVGISVHELST